MYLCILNYHLYPAILYTVVNGTSTDRIKRNVENIEKYINIRV